MTLALKIDDSLEYAIINFVIKVGYLKVQSSYGEERKTAIVYIIRPQLCRSVCASKNAALAYNLYLVFFALHCILQTAHLYSYAVIIAKVWGNAHCHRHKWQHIGKILCVSKEYKAPNKRWYLIKKQYGIQGTPYMKYKRPIIPQWLRCTIHTNVNYVNTCKIPQVNYKNMCMQ